MHNNPGKAMTTYDIPSIVATAFPIAMTPTNIQAGFRTTGIYPFNRSLFTAVDFSPSFVTDRSNPNLPIEIAVIPNNAPQTQDDQSNNEDPLSGDLVETVRIPNENLEAQTYWKLQW